jgi:hypothetical protein
MMRDMRIRGRVVTKGGVGHMRSLLLSSLVAALLVGTAEPGRAEPAAETLLTKAIAAHGGAESLSKYKSLRLKLKVVMAGPDSTPKVWEQLFWAPNKYKDVREGYYLGRKTAAIYATNGKAVWATLDGRPQELTGHFADWVTEDAHLLQAMRLVPLTAKDYHLQALGESTIDGKAASGLLVRTQGQKDITLSFDAASGLLVKVERQVYDHYTEKQAREERFYHDYPKNAALPYARKVRVKVGGRNELSYEVTDVKFLETVDENQFRQPQ